MPLRSRWVVLSHRSSLLWASPTSCVSRTHFASLIEFGLWSLSLTHRISHVHCMVICKHAISHNPDSLWLCSWPFLPTKLQASTYLRVWPTARFNEANLFAFAMAYLPLRRALALALRLLPSSSLTSERTIRCAGFPPASHATLRGAPDYTDYTDIAFETMI